MNSASIPAVKKMIRNLDTQKARRNEKKIMALDNVQDISDFILKEYEEILPFIETDD